MCESNSFAYAELRVARTLELYHKDLTNLFARVKFVVDRSQARLEHVRVNLRRRQVRVPEHHLDRAQIRAPFQQVRREGVPQDVRADIAGDARLDAVVLQHLPESHA